MAGQMIVLSGLNAGAAAGGPAVRMTAADQIAARIPSLAYAITPSTLKTGADGLLTGRDRSRGAMLKTAGSSANLLRVSPMANRPALNTGNMQVAASLDLPAGSVTPSYSVVMAVYLGEATLNTAPNAMNPIMAMGPTQYIATALRYYGNGSTLGDPTYKGQFVSGGSGTTAPWARVNGPQVSGWCILTACYDDVTKQATVGLNGSDTSTVLKTSGLLPDATSYWSVGYSKSAAGLQDSGIGDTYIFSESLLVTGYGQDRLAALVSALKTQYGVV